MRGVRALLCLLLCCVAAHAAGPRFVTGRPYFTGRSGLAIGWKGPTLLYSTDPGDLSANVNHAAADALVTAAAGVWNVPVASITLGQGSALAEHVSGQNVYMGANGLVFPADVMASNAAAVPLAIVYDSDGSVTDTLLGAGASLPSGCRQNAVTESVDGFDPAGYITHAIIVINGRCTGTAAAAQLQLRYQLMRAFGRVLGLAWSQTNDNVFTGVPVPTPVQAQNWPIMHPIDIICGLYTYQCLPNPFTLRLDDIAGLVGIYPIWGDNGVPAGKQLSYANAQGLQGKIEFPTGEGMAGVNVLVRRMVYSTTIPDAFYVTSGVTGAYGLRGRSSSFVTADPSALGSQGDSDTGRLGQFFVPWVPIPGGYSVDDRITTTEPINPLYTGAYTLGPYPAGNVLPSGSAITQTTYIVGAGVDYVQFTAGDAAASCGTGGDGTASSPMQAAATGWWPGLICGYGHVSYVSATVRPGRTFTLEVTAQDAQGLPTMTKLMPVLGLFGPYDAPPYTPPSLGASVSAFNGLAGATTTLHASTGNAASIRFGIADQRGDGRPDFNYQARLFYADSLAPAQVAAAGGTVTISGLGFRNGNAVTVNGVAAVVKSWSANAIVVTLPSAAAAGAGLGTAVDVTVTDRGTGATSTMTAVLIYSGSGAQATSMRLIGAPAGTQMVGDAAGVPFSVQMVGADGTTPIAGIAVTFSADAGSVAFAACGSAGSCTLRTDASGLAATQVTPTASGGVTLRAAAGSLAQTTGFTVIDQASQMLVVSTPESPLRVGAPSSTTFAVQDLGPDGRTPLPNRAITFSAIDGAATFDACYASPCTLYTDWTGTARVGVIPQSTGTVTVQARDGDLSQTVTLTALTNLEILRVTTAPPSQFYLNEVTRFGVTLYRADGVTPDPLQSVTFAAPPGIHFEECAGQVCSLTANSGGYAYVDVDSLAAGTFTLQATYGNLAQSVTFTVISHHWQLKVLSVPPDDSPTGVVAAQPFKVQVVEDDGVTPAPVGGRSMILGGNSGAVSMTNCVYSACEIWMGGDATATAWIIPQQPGPLTLSAIYAPMVTTATFTAVGGSRTLKVVSQPGPGGAPYGRESDIVVQAISPDGVTPIVADIVTASVLSGPYAFYQGAGNLILGTDGNGIVIFPGLATGYGPVVVQVTDGYVTRLISFVAGTPPRVLRLLSTPPSPSTTGRVAAQPFQVQVFMQDGVTPAAGEHITFTLTGGAAVFGSCAATVCVVATDAAGMALVQVTPLEAGVVGLLAADGYATLAANFTAIAAADLLRVTGAPADGGYVGTPSAQPFAVRVLLADGVTPGAGKAVTLSVTSGAATFVACAGAATCTLHADSAGNVSTLVTPASPGSITLRATDAATSVSAAFTAIARPDILRLVSAPSGSAGVGYAAAPAFAVQVLTGDGSPVVGRSVVFSASTGNLRFGCGGSTCSLLTGAGGTASTTVTPLAAGPVTLIATQGQLTLTAFFTAVAQPDLLRVITAPVDGGYAGLVSARPFSVQALLADGATPAAGRAVSLSVTSGAATFAACAGAASCTLQADSAGMISSSITPLSAGSITLQAADGGTAVSATFTTIARPDTLQFVSAPAGSLPTGVQAVSPFSVRLLLADGAPDPGRSIVFTATGATFATCGNPCTVQTAADGTAAVSATPTVAGPVTLKAAYGTLTQTVTFTAYDRPDTLQLLTAPAGSLPTGVQAASPFSVRLLLADGSPDPGRSIVFTATGATFATCGNPCTVQTAADGTAAVSATPTVAGPVTLKAAYGTLTQTATFTAYDRPDTLRLVSAPSSGGYAGLPSALPFAVQVLAADGTPAPGRSVTLAVTSGSATLSACAGAATCVLIADASGSVSSTVTPTAAGTVTLLATSGQAAVSASFTAIAQPQPDLLRLVSAPGAGSYVGAPAAAPFAVRLTAADGTPRPGVAVAVSLLTGSAGFAACSSSPCTLLTDATGIVSTIVTPLAPGTITIVASTGTLTASASFTAVDDRHTLTAQNPTLYLAENAVADLILSVQAAENGSPAASQGVHWTGQPSLRLAASDTVTDSTGRAVAVATAGPLAAGAQARATACAWPGVCAAVTVHGVASGELQPLFAAGAAQSVSSALLPVTVLVTDAAAHPVAGAPVTVYQTVTAYAAPCPVQGRCPSATVLASLVTVAATDAGGRYSFTPLTVEGQPTQTQVAVSTGSGGFAATTLLRHP